MKYKREYDGFDTRHEGWDTKVDVVVRCSSTRAEEFAIQDVENELESMD